jgi:hypothetical protein
VAAAAGKTMPGLSTVQVFFCPSILTLTLVAAAAGKTMPGLSTVQVFFVHPF